jgi:FkbM family methyltransferase
MKIIDYFGWTVLEEDNRYKPLIEKNTNITNEDQEEISKVLEEFVPNRRTVLEVGVHYGFFTRWLSNKFKLVHTFDFNNDVLECFRINMQKFEIKNFISHPYGLGHEETNVATNDIKKNTRGPLANHIDLKSQDKKFMIKTLDSLEIEDVDFIMIDTEGFEYFVLLGAQNTIRKYKPPMIVEFHHKNLSQKFFNYPMSKTEEYLNNLGYQYIKNVNRVDRLYVHRENLNKL